MEERIYDAVDEYLANSEAYKNAGLHVWLDEKDMIYRAEVDDNLAGSEDDGIYAVETVVRKGDEDLEPEQMDKFSDEDSLFAWQPNEKQYAIADALRWTACRTNATAACWSDYTVSIFPCSSWQKKWKSPFLSVQSPPPCPCFPESSHDQGSSRNIKYGKEIAF